MATSLWEAWAASSGLTQAELEGETLDPQAVKVYQVATKEVEDYFSSANKTAARERMAYLDAQIRYQSDLRDAVVELEGLQVESSRDAVQAITAVQIAYDTNEARLMGSGLARSSALVIDAQNAGQGSATESWSHLFTTMEKDRSTIGTYSDVQLPMTLDHAVETLGGVDKAHYEKTGEIVFEPGVEVGDRLATQVNSWNALSKTAKMGRERAYNEYGEAEKRLKDITAGITGADGKELDVLMDQYVAELARYGDLQLQLYGGLDTTQATAAMEQLRTEDPLGSELYAQQQDAYRRLYPEKSDERTKALSNPQFQAWAEDHGYNDIGQMANGVFVEGGDADRALAAWWRESQRDAGSYGPRRKGTGEFVEVELGGAGPQVDERYRLNDGRFAYMVDPVTGERRPVKQSEIERYTADYNTASVFFVQGVGPDGQPTNGYLRAGPLVYDISGDEPVVITDAKALAEAQAAMRGQPLQAVTLEGENGEHVRFANLQDVDSGATLGLIGAGDPAAAKADIEAIKAKAPQFTYEDAPPEREVIRGERMRIHADDPPGTVRIRTSTGIVVIPPEEQPVVNLISERKVSSPGDLYTSALGAAAEARVTKKGAEAPEQYKTYQRAGVTYVDKSVDRSTLVDKVVYGRLQPESDLDRPARGKEKKALEREQEGRRMDAARQAEIKAAELSESELPEDRARAPGAAAKAEKGMTEAFGPDVVSDAEVDLLPQRAEAPVPRAAPQPDETFGTPKTPAPEPVEAPKKTEREDIRALDRLTAGYREAMARHGGPPKPERAPGEVTVERRPGDPALRSEAYVGNQPAAAPAAPSRKEQRAENPRLAAFNSLDSLRSGDRTSRLRGLGASRAMGLPKPEKAEKPEKQKKGEKMVPGSETVPTENTEPETASARSY